MSTTLTSPLAVNDPIMSTDDMDDLPAGTRMCVGTDESEWYEKVADGHWDRFGNDTTRYNARDFSMGGYNKVLSLPEGTVVQHRPPDIETLAQYQWKFRDGTLAGAIRASISLGPVVEALDELGVGEDPPMGPGVAVRNSQTRERLPDGTILYTGRPHNPSAFGVFVKQGGHWRHVLGGRTSMENRASVIESGPDLVEPDWLTRPPIEEEARLIAEFRAKAWEVGLKKKSNHGWCSEFERVMAAVGVTAAAAREAARLRAEVSDEPMVGSMVTTTQAAALPVGTVLGWESTHDDGRWAFYRRLDGVTTNRAHTRRVCGYAGTWPSGAARNGGHFAASMRVLYLPGTDMAIRIPGDRLPHLPVGTRLHPDGGSRQDWGISQDQSRMDFRPIRPTETGGYNVADFADREVTIDFLPEVTA